MITIDPATGFPTRPWAPQALFSPPNAWSLAILDRADAKWLSEFIPPGWCSRDLVLIPALVPPPPPYNERELQELRELRAIRPRFMRRIENEDAYDFCAPLMAYIKSAGLAPGRMLASGKSVEGHLRDLAKMALNDAQCVVLNQKLLFNRARPYQLDHRLDPRFKPPHASYPSGHATQAVTLACLIEAAFANGAYAAAAETFTDHAQAVARRREIGGMHYSSDTVAGFALAEIIAGTYLASNAFVSEWIAPLRALK